MKYAVILGFLVPTLATPILCSVCSAGEIRLRYPTATGSLPIKTWKDLRDAQVVKQNLDVSCGSAAAATILQFFYGRDISEEDILAEVIAANLAGVASDFERSIRSTLIRVALDGAVSSEDIKRNLAAQIKGAIEDGASLSDIEKRFVQAIQAQLEATASFADLEQAVEKFGFRAVGLSLDFGQLKQISIPVIAHLRHQGQEHFSVVRGIGRDGLVLLGDPAWGNQSFEARRFRAMWEIDGKSGSVLVLLPKDATVLAQAEHDFFHAPKLNVLPLQNLILLRKP